MLRGLNGRAGSSLAGAVEVRENGIVRGIEAIMHEHPVGEVFVRSFDRQIIDGLNPTF